MRQIVTLTLNPTVDKNSAVDQVIPEHKLRCDRPRREPGGGGLNVSRAVARLGGTSRAFYPCGGPIGTILKGLLDEEELDHHPIENESWTRENLIVYEKQSGRQYRFGMPGPQLMDWECEAVMERLRSLDPPPDYLVASGSLPPGVPEDLYATVGRIAHEMGARYILDTSGEALRRGAAEGTFLLKPNLRELSQLAERPLEHEREQEAAAKELIDGGCCSAVLVSLGAAGAMLVTADSTDHLRSPTVPIRSKVGAGDSTVAGIVLALARGMDLHDSARYGIAAGAAAVMTLGTELCRKEDTDRLFKLIRPD